MNVDETRGEKDAGSGMRSLLRTIGVLALLLLLFPVTLGVVLICALFRLVPRAAGGTSQDIAAAERKTILVSGGKMTKALQLARSFKAAGHRVVMIETHDYWLTGHRYSNAVDRFLTVPDPTKPGYAEALLGVVLSEGVDVYVPVCSPVASLHDSAAMRLLSDHCEVVHVDPDRIMDLDDKYRFAKASEALGLAVPKSVLIEHCDEVAAYDFSPETRPFILKSLRYDPIRRLDLTKLPLETPQKTAAYARSLPISPDNPFVMQEFIRGKEYCTHGTLRGGELRIHCCCESSAFQINYEHVERPEIEAWVKRFGKGLSLTGQASFDFIEAEDDGRIYAIECNPRTHSAITMFYDHPDVARGYLGGDLDGAPIRPTKGSRPTYWLYHELWRLLRHLRSPKKAVQRLRIIWKGKDAVFDRRDPLPFLMLHHWQIPLLLLRSLRRGRPWLKIDFNIGKLVQPGGD